MGHRAVITLAKEIFNIGIIVGFCT
jgi:hypothetical protein